MPVYQIKFKVTKAAKFFKKKYQKKKRKKTKKMSQDSNFNFSSYYLYFFM